MDSPTLCYQKSVQRVKNIQIELIIDITLIKSSARKFLQRVLCMTDYYLTFQIKKGNSEISETFEKFSKMCMPDTQKQNFAKIVKNLKSSSFLSLNASRINFCLFAFQVLPSACFCKVARTCCSCLSPWFVTSCYYLGTLIVFFWLRE